jgi:hypothetical protein
MMSSLSEPLITVVMVVGRVRARAAAALVALLGQERVDQAQILLIDSAPAATPPLPGSDDPRVQTMRMAETLHMGDYRAAAVHAAQTPLIAFTEEHAYCLPGWLAGILDAFATGPWFAVSGTQIFPDRSLLTPADLAGVQNFGPYLERTTSAVMPLLPGHNTAYRRAPLLACGAELPRLLLSEPLLQRRLTAQGYELYCTVTARYLHRNERTLRAMFRAYSAWNMVMGDNQRAEISRLEWLGRIIFWPLMVPVRLRRTLRTHARHPRVMAVPWSTRLQVALCIHSAEAWGALRGNLGLTRGAIASLTHGELNLIERDWLEGIDS